MLVLSRQKDETIMIGDDVEITVVDIRGDKVRLGITAPSHIPVHRKEVYEAIKRENRAAAQVTPEDLSSLAPSSRGSDNGKGAQSVKPPGPKPPPRGPGKRRPQNQDNGETADSNSNQPGNSASAENDREGTRPATT